MRFGCHKEDARVVESAGYAAEGFASARAFLDWLPRGRAACLVLETVLDAIERAIQVERAAGPTVAMASGHGKGIA